MNGCNITNSRTQDLRCKNSKHMDCFSRHGGIAMTGCRVFASDSATAGERGNPEHKRRNSLNILSLKPWAVFLVEMDYFALH